MIHACQARIVSDIAIVTEAVPDQVTMSGQVIDIVRLAPDVIGVRRRTAETAPLSPGQFCKVQYRGFPGEILQPDLSPGRSRQRSPDAFSHPKVSRRNCLLGAGPKNPHRHA